MKNFEKYADVIRRCKGSGELCEELIKPYILQMNNCNDVPCDVCRMHQMVWLNEEYEEPNRGCTIDWYKVPVDTPILVRDSRNEEWQRKHFALYKGGKVYAWSGRCTSWTIEEYNIVPWNYAKLVK